MGNLIKGMIVTPVNQISGLVLLYNPGDQLRVTEVYHDESSETPLCTVKRADTGIGTLIGVPQNRLIEVERTD